MSFWGKYNKYSDRIVDIVGVLGASMMLLIMLIVCAGVFMRNVFNKPIAGVEEISQDLLLYSAFLMAIWLMRKDGHAKVDLVISKLSRKAKARANIILYSICGIVCLLLVWFGGKIVIQDIAMGLRETSFLMVPTWILIIIIPVGYFLIFTQIIKAIGKYRDELKSASDVSVDTEPVSAEKQVEAQRFNNN